MTQRTITKTLIRCEVKNGYRNNLKKSNITALLI